MLGGESTPAIPNPEYPMKTKALLSLLLVAGLTACAKEEAAAPAEEGSAPVAEAPAADAAPAPAEAAADTTAAPAVAAEAVTGIPECDNFLAAYATCVNDKIPAESRATFEQGLAQWRQSWKDMAVNPVTKPMLADVCKTASNNASVAIAAYGCKF
jgi:hypothetical protein